MGARGVAKQSQWHSTSVVRNMSFRKSSTSSVIRSTLPRRMTQGFGTSSLSLLPVRADLGSFVIVTTREMRTSSCEASTSGIGSCSRGVLLSCEFGPSI
jgi:hypothetical protein